MTIQRCRSISALVLIGLLLTATTALATYRYKDAQGNTCFVDDWRTIPLEFRASTEPPIPNQPPAPPPTQGRAVVSSPEQPPPNPQPDAEKSSLQAPKKQPAPPTGLWNDPRVLFGSYVLASLIGLGFLYKIMTNLTSPALGRLILLAIFLGVMGYGYKLYVDNMVDGYFAVKKKTTVLMEKAMKREATALPEVPQEGTPPPTQQ